MNGMCVTLVLLICLLSLSVNSKGEEMTVHDYSVEPMISYKKEKEFNPLYTQRFGADPGVMEFDGRLYVYMTDDMVEYNANGTVRENTYSKIRTINCISSDDLVNWTDHGQIQVAGPTGAARWAGLSWAPCAAHKTINGKEKFFLYFCNGGNGIGVLSADSPIGPWRDEVGKALVDRSKPNCADVVWLFDPAVMVDDDGTGYLAFGGGVPEGKQEAPGTGRIVRLGEDMISLDGDPVKLDVPWLFEDSGLNKIGGQYIYSYCSNWQTEGNRLRLTSGAIEYMTADSPLGPYTYVGELFPNEGRFFGMWGNNHHSIACLNGDYYLFYHNRPGEKAMGISGNYRSPQINRLYLDEEGRFRQAVGTMKGVDQLKPMDPYGWNSACTISHEAGIRVVSSGELIRTVTGSWIRITGVDFREGSENLTIRAQSAEGGTVYAVPGRIDQPVAAVIPVSAGEEQNEYTVPCRISGVTDLYFVFEGEIRFCGWQADQEAD